MTALKNTKYLLSIRTKQNFEKDTKRFDNSFLIETLSTEIKLII